MRIGLLFDFPQGDHGAGLERALRHGLEATGVDPTGVEFLHDETLGHPAGPVEDVIAGFDRLAAAGVDLVIGPSISDNCVAVRDAADGHELPAINYSGGERTRSDWMFQYQVGSLEEEPPLLVARMRERSLRSCVIVHDASVVGDRYREVFGWSARDVGIDVLDATAIDPLSTDVGAVVAKLRTHHPDVVLYLGLGASSHAVATAINDQEWAVPVLANSALMFGYVRPDWHEAWAGWEYIDTIADDNIARRAFQSLDPRSAASPVGCCAYDLGRMVGLAMGRAERLDRPGLREGLERVKQIPAASGYEGTLMGFGVRDRGALKGQFLVLREWRDGTTVQVER
ncbi:MAG: ABC transporter substrate-binding protein [Acidimicrobiia bacterium]|nr:ABC transporter substrate-binding protein [Acidimicrobiia bacterium]